MAMRAALILLVLVAAGCGGTRHAATTVRSATHTAEAAAPTGLRVGIVGPLTVRVPGTVVVRGALDRLSDVRLVLVSATVDDAATVAAAAASNPTIHYVLVGAPTRGNHRRNLAGVVLREDQAALLGGVVAAHVADEEGGIQKRIAWVGPEERALAAAFGLGAHDVDHAVDVLRVWSQDTPAACKEAALGATDRGAVVVMAHGGNCAEAAIAGAHERNHPGLRLADFEFPSIAAAQIVRAAVIGIYRGNEDIVFGAASGAIGVNRLDPRISPATAIAARTAAQDVANGLRPSR
jgi:basic membrane lipoprotein Med (substrate-binding protein (PBP1-ABC) superfamily)